MWNMWLELWWDKETGLPKAWLMAAPWLRQYVGRNQKAAGTGALQGAGAAAPGLKAVSANASAQAGTAAPNAVKSPAKSAGKTAAVAKAAPAKSTATKSAASSAKATPSAAVPMASAETTPVAGKAAGTSKATVKKVTVAPEPATAPAVSASETPAAKAPAKKAAKAPTPPVAAAPQVAAAPKKTVAVKTVRKMAEAEENEDRDDIRLESQAEAAALEKFVNGLPARVKAKVDILGAQPSKDALREAVLLIAGVREWVSAKQLAAALQQKAEQLTTLHLIPMVNAGQLQFRHPENENHPEQAFKKA